MDKAEYAALRLRQSYYVSCNRCGCLLAARLRAQRQPAAVAVIRHPEEPVVTSDTQIASAFRSFYQALYSTQEADLGTSMQYLERAHTTKLLPHLRPLSG
ncbi:hypothetical protein NDU88_001932 [Pleurodeles waltl]|uniref:Uncharacterized protein n=1 Tax=Pleurodeles waltl TaxID=8319 RepID=A0AAV7ML52_PLEWA|nr:hypothetical protein NDU88_001932 [Pleurodeles waltl]